MASIMLTGDRRWAPTRKSGMTVLGKVPKPINLPSQRLENHGLVPNVEIVPKGTLTWGSRPSSTIPNVWASSPLLSPNTDGSPGSPSDVNGRPSSGSGTRPSTAGNDRSHKPASNAWGPNLRPSSASGSLISNQTSIVATRPWSAETRPSSTHLSRFAETPVESTVAWGPTRTAERMGPASSKTNEFTLSSGDFPTLGSDKNSDSQMQQGHSSHGRPGSASGTAAAQKEAAKPLSIGGGNEDASSDRGNVNSWQTDGYPCVGGVPPNMKWQRDPQQAQQYTSGNIPPQHFGPWYSAPIHSPDGVWYRGGAVGGPYRPATPPGSYPMEPYAYYPQFSARPLPHSEPVPRPGAGPGGYHPKNGESYHHHQSPDSYMVPSHSVIPVRPGVYPSPVPYEGYYGPPHASFCNSSDREVPVRGMSDQFGVYDQHPNQNANFDPGKFHAMPSGHASVMAKEQKESVHAHETSPGQYKVLLKHHDGWEDTNDAQEKREQSVMGSLPQFDRGMLQGTTTREEDWRRNSRKECDRAHETHPGQYKVLLKHHDGWGGTNDAQEKREQSVMGSLPQFDRGMLQGSTTREEDWRRNSRKDERTVFVKLEPVQEALSLPASDWEGHSTNPVITNTSVNSRKETDDSLIRKPEHATFPVKDLQSSVMKKNASLIEKIEGLNNKARCADGCSGGNEKTKHFKVANKADNSTKIISTNGASTEYAPTSGAVTSVSDELDASTGNGNQITSEDEKVSPKPSETFAFVVAKSDSSEVGEKAQSQVHKRAHVMRGRTGDLSKLRSNSQDANERIKKSPGTDISVMATMKNGGNDPVLHLLDCHASEDAAYESHHAANTAGVSYVNSTMDSMDHKAQRAKLKEKAMWRAKELQKEEEERTREQKAKALAKLEELNTRTLAQSLNQKNHDIPPSNDVQHKLEEEELTTEQKEKALTVLEELNRRTSTQILNQKNHDLPPSNDVQHKQDSGAGTALKIDAIIIEAPGPISTQNSDSMMQANDSGVKNLVGSTDLSVGISSHVSIFAIQDSAIPYDLSLSLGQKNSTTEVVAHLTSSDIHESNVSKRKHMGSRRRPNISKEENLSEKPTAAENMGSPKNPGEVAIPTLSSDSFLKEETSVHHRKRNNRNARNKNMLDEALTRSTLPTPAPTKGNLEKGPIESGNTQPLTYVAESTPDPDQSFSETIVNQVSITSSDQGQSQATENVHGRVGSQLKPQSNRKSTKNQQARPADKFHGSEAVIWAPVRPSNRNVLSEEVRQKSISETDNHTSGKNGHDVQNVMKAKRAEMERYVPKHVAKELSQQENSQEPSPSLDQAASGNLTRKPDSGSKSFGCGRVDGSALGKPDFASDAKNGEVNKPNRRGKMRASWRQRSSAESPLSLQSSTVGLVSDPTKPMLEPSDQNQQPNFVSLPESQFQHDDWNSNNDNLMPSEKTTVPAVVKDQGVPSTQREQQFVLHEGSNYVPTDNKDLQSGPDDKIYTPSLALAWTESDRRNASRTKNQNVGGEHRRSHWQPKSQAYSRNCRHEYRGDEGQIVASQGVDKESQSQSIGNYPLQNEYNSVPAPRTDSEKRNTHHEEASREKKVIVGQSNEQACSTNQDLRTNAELPPVDVSAQHEQPVSSARRRQGHYNGHFSGRQEATFRGRDLGQDASRQSLHTNGDKRRSNLHFEYQQIGSYNKSGDLVRASPIISKEAQEGPRPPGLKYRERGQHHSRRGSHFYGQRSAAAIQVGDSYNSGE